MNVLESLCSVRENVFENWLNAFFPLWTGFVIICFLVSVISGHPYLDKQLKFFPVIYTKIYFLKRNHSKHFILGTFIQSFIYLS